MVTDNIRSFQQPWGPTERNTCGYIALVEEILFVYGIGLSSPLNVEKNRMYINLAQTSSYVVVVIIGFLQ